VRTGAVTITTKRRRAEGLSYLSVGDLHRVTVAHRTDVDAELAFTVALPKELRHHAVHPLAVDVRRFRRVAKVGAVQHLLQQLVHAHNDDTG